MFDEQTDAFERLVIMGRFPRDHEQKKGYDYRTDLKVELKRREKESTPIHHVQKGRKEIHRTKPKTISTPIHHVQKPLSVKDLLTKRKPTEWVIEQIGAKGNLVLLAGESGCGKTSLMYSMVKAISSGEKFLGTFEAVKNKVLFIQADESKNNCAEKCHTMGIPDDIDFTFAEDGWENLHLEDVARLEDPIGDKYGAIFLDSITSCYQARNTALRTLNMQYLFMP